MILYVFNPDNDMALANGEPGYTPPASICRMMQQTALMPVCWVQEGDGVLVGSRVWVVERRCDKCENWSDTLSRYTEDALVGLGHWEMVTDVLPRVTEVRPWGWSPAICHRLRVLGIPEGLMPSAEQLAEIRRLSNRRCAVDMLRSIVGTFDWLKGESQYCSTEQEVEAAMERWPINILKAPWSSSGKGLRFGQGGQEATLAGWYRRVLQQQGGVVVEPLYEKQMDFAMEFWSDGCGQVAYRGLSLFETHPNGAYKGNRLWCEEQKWDYMAPWLDKKRGMLLAHLLEQQLARLIGTAYRGPLGVDMMVLADGCIHPCVEINLRMTMGYVALLLH